MTPNLIGLAGYAQSGKNTVADILVRDHGYTAIGFADALREFMLALDPIVEAYAPHEYLDVDLIRYSELVGYSGGYEGAKKFPEVRALLQRLGTDAGRKVLGENVWVDAAMRRVGQAGTPVVLTDVRFPNEYNAVINPPAMGEMWRVVRPGCGPINGHESETALDGFSYQEVIVNGGTLGDLEYAVRTALLGAV